MIESNPHHTHALDRAGWFKSSYSESNAQCVEAKYVDRMVFLGDTKNNGQGPLIGFAQAQWKAFLTAIVTEPVSAQVDHVKLTKSGSTTSIIDTTWDVRLDFHQPEIDAFLRGVRNGEFNSQVDQGMLSREGRR